MLLGTFVPKLDEKGRIILPAKFSDELRRRRRDDPRPGALHLRVQPARVRGAPRARSGRRRCTGKEGRDFLRLFLSGATQEIPDKQHRVTIPPMLREYAGLDRELTVIGAGSRAEIWDTAAWNTYYAATESRLRRHRRGGDRGTLLAPRARPSAAHPDFTSPEPGRSGWGSGPRGRPRTP